MNKEKEIETVTLMVRRYCCGVHTIKHIINKQRPPGDLLAGAAVFRGTLFFLPYFAASTSTPT